VMHLSRASGPLLVWAGLFTARASLLPEEG
jgi:hypothetical protein